MTQLAACAGAAANSADAISAPAKWILMIQLPACAPESRIASLPFVSDIATGRAAGPNVLSGAHHGGEVSRSLSPSQPQRWLRSDPLTRRLACAEPPLEQCAFTRKQAGYVGPLVQSGKGDTLSGNNGKFYRCTLPTNRQSGGPTP